MTTPAIRRMAHAVERAELEAIYEELLEVDRQARALGLGHRLAFMLWLADRLQQVKTLIGATERPTGEVPVGDTRRETS